MKMKSILLPGLLILAACSQGSGISVPTLKYDGLKGDVGAIKEQEINRLGITYFDKRGHQVRYEEYGQDGVCVLTVTDRYRRDLLVREKTETYPDTRSEKHVVSRKDNYVKWDSDTDGTVEMFYDGLHYCAKNAAGELLGEAWFDETGRLTRQKNYSAGTVVLDAVREYDGDGRLIRQTEYHPQGDTLTFTYSYPHLDENGNWLVRYNRLGDRIIGSTQREIYYRK